MYPCTQDIIDLFTRNCRQVARITFNGKYESFVITESDIMRGGLTIDRYSVSGSKIELGSAIAGELSMKLKNFDGKYDDTVFEGAELFVELGVKDWDDPETDVTYIPCGYFIVDTPPRALSTISISALDRMVLFDKTVDMSLIKFPITVENLIRRVCQICGVDIATDLSSLINRNYGVKEAPSSEYLTYRTLIQWCAFITGTCAYMDYEGNLVFSWYQQTAYTVTPSERYSSDMFESDITITGLVYTSDSNQTYVVGETDYSLTYNSCGLLQENVESALDNIYYSIRNFSYRPYQANIKPAPFMFPLDMIHYRDKNGVMHDTIITHITSTINNGSAIQGSGETLTSNDYSSSSGLTPQQEQAMREMKNSIEVTINAQDLEELDLSEIIAVSLGFNISISTEGDKRYFYVHNGPTLAVSDCIYTLKNGRVCWADDWNDGDPQWSTTFTRDNNAVLDVLKRYKLNGENLQERSIGKEHLTLACLADIEQTINQKINTVIADYMKTSDIEALAKYIFITRDDGIEYRGRLKIIDGKPVFDYEGSLILYDSEDYLLRDADGYKLTVYEDEMLLYDWDGYLIRDAENYPLTVKE